MSEVTRAAALVVGMFRKCIASEHRNSLMDDRRTCVEVGGEKRGAKALNWVDVQRCSEIRSTAAALSS